MVGKRLILKVFLLGLKIVPSSQLRESTDLIIILRTDIQMFMFCKAYTL